MQSSQRIRVFLFYLSVLIFLSGLPFILSSTLNYKFDRRTFKFTKTGLISIKTQPPGASIYFNNKLLQSKTPGTIDELLPGTYSLRLELDKHYPWASDIRVEAGRVVRLEKIILFPTSSDIKQLNKEGLFAFWIDQDKGLIYYVNRQEPAIYKSDLDGDNYEKISAVSMLKPPPLKFLLSYDKKKILYFNQHEIGIRSVEPEAGHQALGTQIVLDYPQDTLCDIYWHSDNYHLILIGEKSIAVMEADFQSKPLKIVDLSKRNTASFYDNRNDALYFVDTHKAAGGNHDRAAAHGAGVVQQQRDDCVAEVGVALALEGERLEWIDDHARQPRRIETLVSARVLQQGGEVGRPRP